MKKVLALLTVVTFLVAGFAFVGIQKQEAEEGLVRVSYDPGGGVRP